MNLVQKKNAKIQWSDTGTEALNSSSFFLSLPLGIHIRAHAAAQSWSPIFVPNLSNGANCAAGAKRSAISDNVLALSCSAQSAVTRAQFLCVSPWSVSLLTLSWLHKYFNCTWYTVLMNKSKGISRKVWRPELKLWVGPPTEAWRTISLRSYSVKKSSNFNAKLNECNV